MRSTLLLSAFLCLLFIQCVENSVNIPQSSTLVSVHRIASNGPGETYEVQYANGKLIKLGSSRYIYNDDGRVFKAIERVISQDNFGLDKPDTTELEYGYTWDDQGRISEIKQLTSLETSGLNTYSGYQPSRKFTYAGSAKVPQRVELEYPSLQIYPAKETQIYFYSNNALDSVRFISYYAEGQQSMRDRWLPGDVTSYPNPFEYRRSSTYAIMIGKSKQENYFAPVFKALGFIPYQLNPFPFEVCQLSHAVDKLTYSANVYSDGRVDSLYAFFGTEVKYNLDSRGRLDNMDYSLRYPFKQGLSFRYSD